MTQMSTFSNIKSSKKNKSQKIKNLVGKTKEEAQL
jgi:hypothetical protein